MKTSSRADAAIIGGSGFKSILKAAEPVHIETPYGSPSPVRVGELAGKQVAFLARHGPDHRIPPHQINYRANIFALHKLGVERIIATNAVGGINKRLEPGTLVIPHDFIDFTKLRKGTFYDASPVTHVDMSQPYCPEVRGTLVAEAQRAGETVRSASVLACTEGPRYETPAEVNMLRHLGCDVVGMTGAPEATLARELEMCYASLCLVSNKAVGLQNRQTINELAKIAEKKRPVIKQVLKEAIASIPKKRGCTCAHALDDARL